jgi:hypothetical protein
MTDYVIVTWPESQKLMDEKGFEEHCHLIQSEDYVSAYFVDKEWYDEVCKRRSSISRSSK